MTLIYISLFNIFRDDIDLRIVPPFYTSIILFLFLCTSSLNPRVTPRIRVLETPVVPQLVKNFPEFYGIRSFVYRVYSIRPHVLIFIDIMAAHDIIMFLEDQFK
jgi:hypothetical protein